MRRTILLITLLLCLTAGTATDAQASGTYEVSACNDAPEAVNNSWVWSTTDSSPTSHYAKHENCPYRTGANGGKSDQEGGLSTTDALDLTNGAPPGTSAGWTFTAPAGTTISAIDYERYLGHQLDPANEWSPALRADGTIIGEETCLDTIQNNDYCYIGGPPGEGGEPAYITGLAAHQLTFGITCQDTEYECVTGATLHQVWAAMYGTKITINDPTPPTLNTPTGALWEPGKDNGYHTGTESLTTTAQDTGGGIQNITLYANQQPIQTYTTTCNYTLPKPCPATTGPQTLTLPTNTLTDGEHTITLIATDAAGNKSTPINQQITVANNPPPAPNKLTATPTSTNDTTYTATWTDPNQAIPITHATTQICPVNNTTSCQPAIETPPTGPATITPPTPGTWTLSVWLTNAAGYTDPNQAATTTLTVPPPTKTNTQQSPVTATPNNNDTSPTNQTTNGPHPDHGNTDTPPALRVHETLKNKKLIVYIELSRATTSRIQVSYTVHNRNKLIASATKTREARAERGIFTFDLERRVPLHAQIVVSVRLGRQTVANRLHRRS